MHTHLTKPMAARSRTSKKVRQIAIRISTPAETERYKVDRVCPTEVEVFSSEDEIYPYHKYFFTEHAELDSM